MIKKGIISNINRTSAAVLLPDENYAVTPMLAFAKSIDTDNVRVGNKCIVAFCDTENINLVDGVIIAIY